MKTYTYEPLRQESQEEIIEVLDYSGEVVYKVKQTQKKPLMKVADFTIGFDHFVQFDILSTNEIYFNFLNQNK